MSVKPVAWTPEQKQRHEDLYQAESASSMASMIVNLEAERTELAGGLRTYIAHYPAFRSKPVGAPGSQAREKQEYEIALEDWASQLLARITPK